MPSPAPSRAIQDGDAVIATPDGAMPACFARPDTGGRTCPAVVIVQHIGGLSPTMRAVARQVASLGFAALVPALYHRLGTIVVDPVSSDPDIAAIRSIAVGSVTPPRLRADIAAALDWLDGRPDIAPGPRGLLGFGGGAGQAMRLAAELPDRFSAFAGILGVGYVRDGDPASPHLTFARFRGGAYFGFAGDDEIIPAAAVEALRAALAQTGVAHRVQVHPGVAHGYLFEDRAVYDQAAAGRDWDAVRDLFSQRIGRPAWEATHGPTA